MEKFYFNKYIKYKIKYNNLKAGFDNHILNDYNNFIVKLHMDFTKFKEDTCKKITSIDEEKKKEIIKLLNEYESIISLLLASKDLTLILQIKNINDIVIKINNLLN